MQMCNSAKVVPPILEFSRDTGFDVVCSISFPVVTRALELSMSFESKVDVSRKQQHHVKRRDNSPCNHENGCAAFYTTKSQKAAPSEC